MDIVSACLIGEECRYNGSSCTDEKLKKMYENGKLTAVCPECDAGLRTPRNPMEIVGGEGEDVLAGRARVVSKDGRDFTHEFIEGAKTAMDEAKEHGAERAYLKSCSPSCGCGRVYDGSFSGTLRKGDGVTAAMLNKNGIMVIEV